jgi:ABC-type polysaccharide/polyol phosphate export permease
MRKGYAGIGWEGETLFVLQALVEKDFKVRYRNMSLGIFWSLLNPLVMMGVLWIVWTRIITSSTPHFAAFALCGLVPFNFFTLAWLTVTTSLVDNSGLIKRLLAPRAVIPVSVVLANCLHFAIQIALLLAISLLSGLRPNIYWLWLPYIYLCEVALVCGLGLVFSLLHVYVRDTRYFVESVSVILFWFVPIVYSFSVIPEQYKWMYRLNPLAALVFATRNIILEGVAPASTLLINLSGASLAALAVGCFVFRRVSDRLYDHL